MNKMAFLLRPLNFADSLFLPHINFLNYGIMIVVNVSVYNHIYSTLFKNIRVVYKRV